jgi:Lar family restriction alleviation protein
MSLFVLPCPFCGALIDREDPAFCTVEYEGEDGSALVCEECQAQGPEAATEEDAIEAWNRRDSK